MARFGFTAVAALVLGVAFALWFAPDEQGPLQGGEPAASETALAELPAAPEPAAPPPVTELDPVPEAPVATGLAPVSSPAAPEPEPEPPATIGVPTLPEEQREIAAVGTFEPDPGEGEAGASVAPLPVDPERSGDLIRRMLTLYRQMRD